MEKEKLKAKEITEFADRTEALIITLGLTRAEAVYVLECLKSRIINRVLEDKSGGEEYG